MIVAPRPGKDRVRASPSRRGRPARAGSASNGSVTRYATLASRYRPITMKVPSASDSGIFRRGSFTSPAVNVMLFQASAENSEPVCDDADRDEQPEGGRPRVRPGTMSTTPRGVHRLPKLSATAAWFQPSSRPTTISPSSAPVLAVVKTFWMILPYSRPRVLVHVSSAISSDADQLRRRQRQRVAGRQVDRAESGSGRRRSTGTSAPK